MNDVTSSRRTRRDVEYNFVRPLLRWGRANRRSFPWRETDDPFHILVAEVLLQRSRGKTVAKVFTEVVRRWPTAEVMSRARVESIRSLIRPLGLTGRAETLRLMAAEIVRRGEVPRTVDDLMELPGVGRYAASATATVAFRKRQPTVDGVPARVYRRFFGCDSSIPPTSDPDLWDLVHEVTPRGAAREWNWAVLDLAASVCLPSRPRCDDCPIVAACALSPARLIVSEDGATLAPS